MKLWIFQNMDNVRKRIEIKVHSFKHRYLLIQTKNYGKNLIKMKLMDDKFSFFDLKIGDILYVYIKDNITRCYPLESVKDLSPAELGLSSHQQILISKVKEADERYINEIQNTTKFIIDHFAHINTENFRVLVEAVIFAISDPLKMEALKKIISE
ncbi:MAG: hypothetical protein ACTSRP_23780 [Candidatus Helarchaeota archaeon]